MSTVSGAVKPRANVLVVDDVDSGRYVLATWLRREGYHVIEAATGQEAIDHFDRAQPDLVVCDINLPDITGYEVCEYIKARPATAVVPVLHLSATAVDTADRTEGLRRGGDLYLVEPVERDELLASVAALLRQTEGRRRAVRAAQRLSRLNDATLHLNRAGNVEQLLGAMVEGAATVFQTDSIAALRLDDFGLVARGSGRRMTGLFRVSAEAVSNLSVAVGPDAVVDGSVIAAAGVSASGRWRAEVLADRDGDDRGAVFILDSADSEEDVADETRLVLRQFTRASGIAFDNVRSYNLEHRIALSLQRSLLPEAPPVIGGLDVVARYEASTEHAEVGGDFFELFEIDEDHVAIAVGDVVGHSLAAAAVMSQLRTGIRAYTLSGHGPSEVLERLNALLLRFHPDTTATVCYAVYQHSSRSCAVANAGHPPPLLIDATGAARFIEGGGPLLGIAGRQPDPTLARLDDGCVLLLFSDGLVERRYESIAVGLQRVATVAAQDHDDLEVFCDRLLRDVGPGKAADDDIVVLAVRPRRSR